GNHRPQSAGGGMAAAGARGFPAGYRQGIHIGGGGRSPPLSGIGTAYRQNRPAGPRLSMGVRGSDHDARGRTHHPRHSRGAYRARGPAVPSPFSLGSPGGGTAAPDMVADSLRLDSTVPAASRRLGLSAVVAAVGRFAAATD